MSDTIDNIWIRLESYRTTTFLFAGLSFTFGLFIVLLNLAAGQESYTDMSYYLLQRASSGAAWAAIFLGVLGFRSSLSNDSGWPLRLGTVFAVIGFFTGLVMVALFVGLHTGLLGDGMSGFEIYILLGHILSIPIGCGTFVFLILRSEIYKTLTGLLVLTPPLVFALNVSLSLFIDFPRYPKIIVVLTVLIVANFSIAYLLRDEGSKKAK